MERKFVERGMCFALWSDGGSGDGGNSMGADARNEAKRREWKVREVLKLSLY